MGSAISDSNPPGLATGLANIFDTFFEINQSATMGNGIAPKPWSHLVIEHLHIGAWEARTQVAELGVTHVISLLTEGERENPTYPVKLPEGVTEFPHAINDASDVSLAPILEECLPQIHAARAERKAVLVHCGAGISRSASVVIAYLITYGGVTYREAHAYLRMRRPVVSPKAGFLDQLRLLVPTVKPGALIVLIKDRPIADITAPSSDEAPSESTAREASSKAQRGESAGATAGATAGAGAGGASPKENT